MIRFATMSFAALLLSSCATAPDVPAARSELGPTGKLRVGMNVQNFLLVNKERVGGEYSGIAVDLGRELGRRLGVPVELVPFDTAGKLADAVKAGAWDVAFLGNEPTRASEIAFSAAYLEIEAGDLVPAGFPFPPNARRGARGGARAVHRQGDRKPRGSRGFRGGARAMTPSPAARSELAPTGKLRVGINYGNFLLVNKDPASGEYCGIAVDLGRELGKRLGVPVDLVAFETAGKLADAVKAGAWGVAFLGHDPQRAGEIAFTPP